VHGPNIWIRKNVLFIWNNAANIIGVGEVIRAGDI
jgi:hypothetical protein